MTTPNDTPNEPSEELPQDQAADQAGDPGYEAPAPASPGLFSGPQRYAAMLPNGRFFVRVVAVTPDAAPASVAEQCELALETVSPFPITQLLHGHFWIPGAPTALVYAAYRKRFPAEEMQEWHAYDFIAPAFAPLVTVPAAAGTVRVQMGTDAVTVLQWGDESGLPTQAAIQAIPVDATDEARVAARDQLLRSLGLTAAFEEWGFPELLSMSDGGDFVFAVGDQEVKIAAPVAALLDIRDKDELAERTRVQRRDIWLWRTVLFCVVLMVVFGGGEVFVSMAKTKNVALQADKDKDKPAVDTIMADDSAAKMIEQTITRQLVPFEILDYLATKKPADSKMIFTQVIFAIDKTNDFTVNLTGSTTDPSEPQAYMDALNADSALFSVQANIVTAAGGARGQRGRGNNNPNALPVIGFTGTMTFKAKAILSEEKQILAEHAAPSVSPAGEPSGTPSG
jgi:hypothetical protein